jgi:hypothetical protein
MAQLRNSTDSDFVLVLSFVSTTMTIATHAVAPAPAVAKKKAENPFNLSDKAYKVAVDIVCSRLQVAPALSAAVDSLLIGVHSIPVNPASRPGQPVVLLSSASIIAAALSGGQKRRRADSGRLSQEPASKKL